MLPVAITLDDVTNIEARVGDVDRYTINDAEDGREESMGTQMECATTSLDVVAPLMVKHSVGDINGKSLVCVTRDD